MEVLPETDVEVKRVKYLDAIATAFHHFFPEKTFRGQPADPPSITDGIKRLMNQRSHAHIEGIVTLYRSLRIIREIKLAKNNFNPSKLQQLKDADSSKRSGQIM